MAPELVVPQLILANTLRADSKAAASDEVLDRAVSSADWQSSRALVDGLRAGRQGERQRGPPAPRSARAAGAGALCLPVRPRQRVPVLGDENRALNFFREAYRQRSSGLIFLRFANFASMARSAEFHSLVEQMHFAG